ncbi:hypothetical protein H8959_007786 [Pygathrix nigripes]
MGRLEPSSDRNQAQMEPQLEADTRILFMIICQISPWTMAASIHAMERKIERQAARLLSLESRTGMAEN